MDAVKIADDIYWVGAIDWNSRNFHGYDTPRGTSYNSFLILDEHPTLIDAVKAPFFSQLAQRIRSVIDPRRIEYIISNHSEPDHASGIRMVQALTGGAQHRSFASVGVAWHIHVAPQTPQRPAGCRNGGRS